MNRLTDTYNFNKFWQKFTSCKREISKWDEQRTDMDVFIRRTLNKWFANKYYQVIEDDWKRRDKDIVSYTKYIQILEIRFSFQWVPKIVIYYLEPHSIKMQERIMNHNDFLYLSIIENTTDFNILHKFYPISITPKPDPFAELKISMLENEKTIKRKQ